VAKYMIRDHRFTDVIFHQLRYFLNITMFNCQPSNFYCGYFALLAEPTDFNHSFATGVTVLDPNTLTMDPILVT